MNRRLLEGGRGRERGEAWTLTAADPPGTSSVQRGKAPIFRICRLSPFSFLRRCNPCRDSCSLGRVVVLTTHFMDEAGVWSRNTRARNSPLESPSKGGYPGGPRGHHGRGSAVRLRLLALPQGGLSGCSDPLKPRPATRHRTRLFSFAFGPKCPCKRLHVS